MNRTDRRRYESWMLCFSLSRQALAHAHVERCKRFHTCEGRVGRTGMRESDMVDTHPPTLTPLDLIGCVPKNIRISPTSYSIHSMPLTFGALADARGPPRGELSLQCTNFLLVAAKTSMKSLMRSYYLLQRIQAAAPRRHDAPSVFFQFRHDIPSIPSPRPHTLLQFGDGSTLSLCSCSRCGADHAHPYVEEPGTLFPLFLRGTVGGIPGV